MAGKNKAKIEKIRAIRQGSNLNRLIIMFGGLLILIFVLLIAILSWQSRHERPQDVPEESDAPLVYPGDPDSGREQEVFLYFRRRNGGYLAPQRRSIVINSDETPEIAAVRELIKGPDSTYSGMNRLLPANTSIVRAEGRGDVFYITFDRELMRLQDSENGMDATFLRERRKLMLYSIVNTISNVGRYAKVQVLIDEHGSGYGVRPKSSDFGLNAETESDLLSALPFNETLLLNASNTAELLLAEIKNGNWRDIYTYYLTSTAGDDPLPAYADLDSRLQERPVRLSEWRCESVAEENTADSYLLRYELAYMLEDGQMQVRQHIPVRMVWEGGRWKMPYSVFERIVEWPLPDGTES